MLSVSYFCITAYIKNIIINYCSTKQINLFSLCLF